MDEATGTARGAAEALSVLRQRPRAQRPDVSARVRALLAEHVDAAAWNAAGLPALPVRPAPPARPGPAEKGAVIFLSRLALGLHCAQLPLADRAAVWLLLEDFFAQQLPPADPEFVRLREVVRNQQVDGGAVSAEIIADLSAILDYHRRSAGDNSYLAGLSRTNLSVAYRQAGNLAEATRLLDDEVSARESRHGPDHPVTLVARALVARSLLLRAEQSHDAAERLWLASRALQFINEVRAVRDRMYGITAANAIRSRRYEGQALLLLGELDRARACLTHALTFELDREGGNGYPAGQTHLLLARVYAAQGTGPAAAEHAVRAQRILSGHAPDGREAREAADLLRQLSAAEADG